MGYSAEWRQRIAVLADALSLAVDIIDVSSLINGSGLEEEVRRNLALRRSFLDAVDANTPTVTPCTNCYNCKIIALVHWRAPTDATVFFAHHAQDALSSFLKSALMFYDRWNNGRAVFERDEFRKLGNQVADELRAGDSRFVTLFRQYLAEGSAQTSEPPRERSLVHSRGCTIVRPLFFVEERATSALVAALGMRAERSGCGHSAAAASRTPRERLSNMR
jgi:hypothetical protein